MGSRMLWMAVLGTVLVWSAAPGTALHSMQRGQAFQISPKPCWVDGVEGTCMFVWECIKSEGYHIGMCVDTFMFGSCCAHNATENVILANPRPDQPSLLYTDPSQNSPQRTKHRPTTPRPKTTSRPHHPSSVPKTGNGSNVISTSLKVRPAHHEEASTLRAPPSATSKFSLKPMSTDGNTVLNSLASGGGGIQTRPTALSGWLSSTEPGFITSNNQNNNHNSQNSQINNQINRNTAKPSMSSSHWKVTTEPAFVTRTKTKPDHGYHNKPKPTKKPVPSSTFKSTIKFVTKTTTTARPPKTKPSSSPLPSTLALSTTQNVPVNVSKGSAELVSSRPEVAATSTFSTVSASSADSMGCGLPQLHAEPQMRIVGGKDAAFGRYPWQVSVRRTSFFGFSSTHRCGGAILNENWIATAGHCVDDLLTSQIRIRVGEYDFSSVREEMPYVERGVSKKTVHPKYNFFTYEYDLALVQLDKPLEFAPHISPICLPASDDLLIGENATVTGWGRLSEGGTLPSVLQEVQVPIVSNDRCKTMFLRAGRHEFIPEIFLCAGHETGGQDSCQGDSGGPLQVRGKDGRYFLAGIISWGIGCAEANLPGVCTRISKFVPWILKNVV